MFLAWRDLKVARGRFALVGIVIALVALLTALLSGLATGLVDDGISGLRQMPLTHMAFQPGAHSSFSRSSLTEKNLQPWAEASGVEASALGVSFFNARTDDGQTVDLALFGLPEGSFLAPDGPARDALGTQRGLVLSEEHRELGIEEGDVLTIVGPDEQLPVLGFADSGSYGHVDIAFSSLPTWQHLVYGDNAHGRFSAIALRADDAPDLAALDQAADTQTGTKEDAYAGSPGFSAETSTMDLIRGFLLVISALIVGAFFTVWTVQRTRQIGLLKALGASNGYVLRDALGQLAVVLVIATAIGSAIAAGLGAMVGSGVPFRLDAGPVVASAVILVVVGMLGSLVAVRRVTTVDPVIALGADH